MSYFKNKKVYSLIGIFVFMLMFFSVIKNISADGLDFGYVDELNNMIICGYSSEDDCNGTLKTWSNGKYSNKVCITGIKCTDSYIPIKPVSPSEDITFVKKYTLLAPIGNFKDIETNDIGKYFNTFLKIAIGLAGALAVVKIIIGGIAWMGTDSVFAKTEAKKDITSAILGLLIALGSYALLNTIDPALLGKNGLNIDQVNIEIVDLPDAGDDSVDPNFKTGKGTYSTNTPVSSAVTSVVSSLKQGWEIEKFVVSSNNNKMAIFIKKGTSVDGNNSISISPGENGYSEIGKGIIGDKKTPKGSWQILNVRNSADGKPVYNKEGSNMGATFWLLSPTTNGNRGIGMHGNEKGTLGETAGCIRMTNSDLLALLPYIKKGTPVIIQ